jgi:hypothetical protein
MLRTVAVKHFAEPIVVAPDTVVAWLVQSPSETYGLFVWHAAMMAPGSRGIMAKAPKLCGKIFELCEKTGLRWVVWHGSNFELSKRSW